MQVHMRIRRFNPEKDSVPWWGDYTVQDVRPNDSVLDVLHRVKWEQDGTLTLMDEVLTPDSSRFWPLEGWREGVNPPSFDKQYLRDWLEQARVDGKPWNKTAPAPALPPEVVAATAERYATAARLLTGA